MPIYEKELVSLRLYWHYYSLL